MIFNLNLGRPRFLVVFFLALFMSNLTFAQVVKGVLVDLSGISIPGVEVQIKNSDFITYSNGSGVFRFYNVPPGDYELISSEVDIQTSSFTVLSEGDVDLGKVQAEQKSIEEITGGISVINVDDLEQIEEDEAGSVSSMLTSSRDPYDRAVAFNLGVLRYRSRGYNSEDVNQYLNNMPMNDLDDGRVYWNYWGGLNDVLRVQNNDLNLRSSEFSFGGLGGASSIDLRASSQRVQKKLVYSLSNRSYTHRLMYTHSTGLMDNGWAFTFAASRRWGESGYIKGTHYDSYSYFASIDKKLSDKHLLNFVLLGAPLRRGKVAPTTQEALDLAGSNFYNPNWGYQNGDVRNAREDRVNSPVAMLTHDWTIGSKTKISTTLGLQTGTHANTRLEWYLAPDPRPDYYRKLPSFQLTDFAKDKITDVFSNNEEYRQLNWDEMYRINKERQLSIQNANGIEGNTVTGNLSGYIIEEQHFDNNKLNLNSVLYHELSDKSSLNGGVTAMYEEVNNYKVVDDLLGGDFFVDYDDFALRDFSPTSDAIQNDLNRPNRILEEGDRFGYDYDIVTQNVDGWLQYNYAGRTIDYFLTGRVGNTSFYRDGHTKVGKFPDNSFGKSDTKSFLTYGGKLGVTYKLDGRNYLYGVASYRTRAPFSRFAFTSPRTRNSIVNDLTEEKILSGEVGYSFRYSKMKGRVSAFYTKFEDQIDNASFYHDNLNTFVNYIMTGVGKEHKGIEGGIEISLPYGFGIEAGGAINQNVYTSRPTAYLTVDNSALEVSNGRTVYMENFYVPGAQTAASLTIRYNSKNYWFINLTGSYVGNNHLDFNPDRRTVVGTDPIVQEEAPELWDEVTEQIELDPIYTLNLFGGKSWKFNDYRLAINLSIGNLLNDKNLITGGFEQYRFDYTEKDINRFPPKYFYGYGLNYNLNVSFNF